jgi:hypothetical protein
MLKPFLGAMVGITALYLLLLWLSPAPIYYPCPVHKHIYTCEGLRNETTQTQRPDHRLGERRSD